MYGISDIWTCGESLVMVHFDSRNDVMAALSVSIETSDLGLLKERLERAECHQCRYHKHAIFFATATEYGHRHDSMIHSLKVYCKVVV